MLTRKVVPCYQLEMKRSFADIFRMEICDRNDLYLQHVNGYKFNVILHFLHCDSDD